MYIVHRISRLPKQINTKWANVWRKTEANVYQYAHTHTHTHIRLHERTQINRQMRTVKVVEVKRNYLSFKIITLIIRLFYYNYY